MSPEPYGPESSASFYLDMLWASGHQALRGATPPPVVGSVQGAKRRLDVARGPCRGVEARDLTTSATAGGGFGASSAGPNYLSGLFATSAKAARVLADRLETAPLPARGMSLTLARLSTSASVTVMSSENAAVRRPTRPPPRSRPGRHDQRPDRRERAAARARSARV